MRTLCDVCESAAAILFCAADEAALCLSCDDKVHMCNKLASRHIRVKLADPNDVPRCDICENAPAFFYCEIDGSSLCLQCDMIVHVGGKRTHGRYLLFRQRVEFPGEKPDENHRVSPAPVIANNCDGNAKMDNKLIDLNARPQRMHRQNSTNQEQGIDLSSGKNNESASMVPDAFKGEPEP